MRSRTTIAAIVLMFLSVSCPLFAVDTSSPWPGYHFGTWRDGWNKACQNLNPPTLMPIWTFPRMSDTSLVSEYPVDDLDAAIMGTWTPEFLSDAWDNRYHESVAVFNTQPDRNKPNPPPIPPEWNVNWSLPPGSPAGAYRIYIWVPTITVTGSLKAPTKYAHYRVVDADVANPGSPWSGYSYEKDLTEGGKWIPLGDRAYRYDGVNPLFVELDQYAKDALHNENPINNPGLGAGNYGDVYLIADAVKFVQDTDLELWASPAAASIMTASGGGDTPVIFVGAREGSNTSHTSISALGAMYCVYSHQGDMGALDKFNVGNPVWKYPVPADLTDPLYTTLTTRDRDDLEGPIGAVLEDRNFAGVYSSPVFFHLPDGATTPSGSTSVVAFGASDRQVYCLDARTGELVWKGPGVTVTEKEDDPDWEPVERRNDAFGGIYRRHPASNNIDRNEDMIWGRTAGPGEAYAVYAWLPAKTAGEDRIPDATYEITYSNGAKASVTVKMDSGDTQGVWVRLGGSYWEPTQVALLTSTSKEIEPGVTYHVVADAVMFVPEDVKNFSYSSPMVTLEYDTSSTPPRDTLQAGAGRRLIIGNTGGRVYAFDLNSYVSASTSKNIDLAWVYPKPRTKEKPSNPADLGEPPLGPISSSIAIESDFNMAYFTCSNGRIYKLGNIHTKDPTMEWIYPNPNVSGKADASITAFTASPALSMGYVYAAGTDGYLYRFNKDPNTAPAGQEEPSGITSIPLNVDHAVPAVPPGTVSELPLGAIRYATPAVFLDDSGIETVYVSSTDGRVYAFESHSDGLRKHRNWLLRPIGTDDYRETAFSTWAPMQAAPCVDGGFAGMPGSSPGLYVACQDGAAYWLDSNRGTFHGGWQTEAMDNGIFASPVVANTYLYVAGTDGRVYAFSTNGTGAFGGAWVGGGSGPPGSRAQDPSVPSKDSVQVDIFSKFEVPGVAHPIYQETLNVIEAINNDTSRQPGGTKDRHFIDTSDLGAISDKGIWRSDIMNATEGTEMLSGHKYALRNSNNTQHFLEWGEDMYVLAWNIDEWCTVRGGSTTCGSGSTTRDTDQNAKKNSVVFRLYNGSAGRGSGMIDISKPADFICEYETQDATGSPVRRCVAGARIQIGQSSDRPQSPGYGWVITCTVNLRSTGTGAGSYQSQKKSVVPELSGVGPASHNVANPNAWVEQKLGINNPLGIKAVAGDPLGWVPNTGMGRDARADVTAHFNGNTGENTDPAARGTLRMLGQWPTLPFGNVDHGTDSNQLPVGVVDRSAIGLLKTVPQRKLDRFRVQNRDLHWRGGASSVLFGLPWDWPPPFQRDYPDIYKRYEAFQQEPDGTDPSVAATSLLPAIRNTDPALEESYDHARLVGQPVNTSVRVPKFQPANANGYISRNMAFVDSNNNGNCETGEVFNNRVTTYQEAYREFDMGLVVPPDFRMTVEESTIDIGAAPHGLGMLIPVGDPNALYAGYTYTNPAVDRWFKEVTVKNQGNVNLLNVELIKQYDLFSDSGDLNYTIPGMLLRSSLDAADPLFGPVANPFKPGGVGATISKARVGEVDPTELRLPDSRPYSEKFEYAPGRYVNEDTDKFWENLTGSTKRAVKPKISTVVPLSQPRGIYGQQIGFMAGNQLPGNQRPVSQPFVMTVDVREDRMTDGPVMGALPMIDPGGVDPTTGKDLGYGDVQPAAWRDKPKADTNQAGNVYLVWSSNRFGPSMMPSPSDPWYLFQASLKFDGALATGFQLNNRFKPFCWQTSGNQWWQPTVNGSPPPAWLQFPDSWPGTLPPLPESIRHTAPFVAVDNDPMDTNVAWLFWQGQADVASGSTGMKREYRIFYTSATGGDIVAPGNIFTFGKDPSQVKMQPRAVTYLSDDNARRLMWLFWYGGSNGRWSIYYNQNNSPFDDHDEFEWSADNVLTTPAALAAVSEPTPIRRKLVTGGAAVNFLDVVYTGLFKQGQNSDIMLTRYQTGNNNGSQLSAKPLPRQYGEVLKRDTKRNVFQAAHIGWVKPALKRNDNDEFWDLLPSGLDRWYTPVAGNSLNYPFIKVIIPVKDDEPVVLFATNGAMPEGTGTGQATLSQDAGSGTHVYTYAKTDPRSQHLGQMIVDASAGTVRFTRTLPPGAKVVAEYTPQTLRLTQGSEADTSPYALLEKTENMNPGFVPIDESAHKDSGQNSWRIHPVDRLWVFWRKPNTSGVQTSTIYYKTYRLTLNMPKDFPIVMNTLTGKPANLAVTGNLGPYEVDPTGTKIYFTEKDERYFYRGSSLPANITVTYTARDLSNNNTEVQKDVVVDGLLTRDGSHNRIAWEQELPHDRPEQALLGWGADTQKNEGQVCAFADLASDTDPWYKSPMTTSTPTRIWVFWMSTRAGNTDLYYETICPSIGAKRR